MVIIIEEVLDRGMRKSRPPNSYPSNPNSRINWRNNPSSTKVEPSKTEVEAKKPSNSVVQPTRSKDVCNFCRQPGHYSRECPKRRQSINEVSKILTTVIKMVTITTNPLKIMEKNPLISRRVINLFCP
jgi:hypothetical protein